MIGVAVEPILTLSLIVVIAGVGLFGYLWIARSDISVTD
jgi:hypothetical protein